MEEVNRRGKLTLVIRKPCFNLPTACPACLPVYCYLKFAQIPFDFDYNLTFPDSDQIPYIESGTYVAYNNEKGGVIESLKEDGVVDLDMEVRSKPEWISMKAMVNSCLKDAIMYELWLMSDGSPVHNIYYSDLPWPIGKILMSLQKRTAAQRVGMTKDNAERIEREIYKNATSAYEALSTWLGEESYFFENRPTSLDAIFLGQALIILNALPETSVLRSKLLDHGNLVRYAANHKRDFIDSGLSSSAPSSVRSDPSSSTPKQSASGWSSKPKSKPKKERTEQEKTLKRRAKYFLVTQLVAVLVYLSLFSESDGADVEVDDDSNFDD